MRDFIRYLLALSVVAAGFYGASRYRLSHEASRSTQTSEPNQLISSATPDPTPLVPRTSRQPALAALIDNERTLTAEPPWDSQAALNTLPGITRRESEQTPILSDGETKAQRSIPPRRRKKDEDPGQRPTSFAPSSIAEATTSKSQIPPVVATNSSTMTNRTYGSHFGTFDEKPELEPSATFEATWDSAEQPLPKLAPRPGSRFVVSERFESKESTYPWETDYERRNGAFRPAQTKRSSARATWTETSTNPSQADCLPRRHRVEVGDTLPKLAARYLGDRDRYLEIFHANEDTLGDPRLLPIGLELEIPPRLATTNESTEETLRPHEEPIGDDLIDALFGTATVPEEAESDLEPIPPQSLPPREFGAWQYSAR